MKKSIAILLAISMVLTTLIVLPLSASAEGFGLFGASKIKGDGSEENPFIVTNESELGLMEDFNDCYFELANDITVTNWVAVGSQSGSFAGSIDGKGYSIKGLNAPFILKNDGTVKNIRFVTGDSFDGGGIFADTNAGTITDCYAEGTVKGKDSIGYLGGAVSYNNSTGKIKNCCIKGVQSCDVSTEAKGYIGGFAGLNEGEISDCCVKGTQNYKVNGARAFYIGGFVGKNSVYNGKTGKISDCSVFATTTVNMGRGEYHYSKNGGYYTYPSIRCAGFGGSLSGTITNCYAVNSCSFTGEFENKEYKGFGYEGSPTITNSYYDKNVSGASDTDYGEPKSTMGMKMESTFTRAGWDFENKWAIDEDENINQGYPYLKNVYRSKILSAEEAQGVKGYVGSAFEELELPEKVAVTTEDGEYDCPVTWSAEGYDPQALTEQTVKGTLKPEKPYANFDEVEAEIKVTLEPFEDITLDKVQSVKMDENRKATMRFFFVPELDFEKADGYGAYIVPLDIFDEGDMGNTALVKKDQEINSGETFSADLRNIPSKEFDADILALPFVKVGNKIMMVIKPELYQGNTVNNTEVKK